MAKCILCGKNTTFALMHYFLSDSTGTRTKNEICQACNTDLVQKSQGVRYNEKTGKAEIFDVEQTSELKLEKNVDSISRYFGGFDPKHAAVWRDAINSMVVSMREEEEILLGFRGAIIYKNRGQEQITDYIGIITNRRFYYAGKDGKQVAFLTYLKSGSVELKDVHAVMLGKDMVFGYVQFEVKNEDYKLTFNSMITNGQIIKEKLEEGIRSCESTEAAPVVVQYALSTADELKKVKELLDMGIISQEEFDAKKKQLLGL